MGKKQLTTENISVNVKQKITLFIMFFLFLSWVFFYTWIFVVSFFLAFIIIFIMLDIDKEKVTNTTVELNKPIYFIKYKDTFEDKTERKITARSLTVINGNDIMIDAFCHLRNEARSFKVSRIISLTEVDTGEEILNINKHFSDMMN